MPSIAIITGKIDSEVKVNTTTNGKKVANFRVYDGQGWTSIVAWEKLADEVPAQGQHVIVHGTIRTRSYDKTVAGETFKAYVTEVNANLIEHVEALSDDAEEMFSD